MENLRDDWELQFGAAFIVPPSRGLEDAEITGLITGGVVDLHRLPLNILRPLFHLDENRLSSRIIFAPENGQQTNVVRSHIRSIAFGSDEEKIDNATSLALRLARVSRRLSKLGLLVILLGEAQGQKRVAMWKFPAERILQAQLGGAANLISQVENAFSTESGYLKAAFFQGDDAETSFWSGKAEDKQARSNILQIADFWLQEFLLAQPETTDSYQTRLLAISARKAIDSTSSVETKTALVSAINVLKARGIRRLSLQSFMNDLLSEEARSAFASQIPQGLPTNVQFRIDQEILSSLSRYQSISLSNGFVVSGPSEVFENTVTIEALDNQGRVRVSVEGIRISTTVKSRK